MNVDKQLEDAWLEAFNSLTVYKLISICAGHPASDRNSGTHLNFRLKAEWFSQDSQNFEKSLKKLQLSLSDLFEQHSCVRMDYTKTYSANRSSQHDIRQSLTISIRPRVRREITDFDDTTRAWFDNMVSAMQVFDSQSRQILDGDKSHGNSQVEIQK
jgi:hypothetical protein